MKTISTIHWPTPGNPRRLTPTSFIDENYKKVYPINYGKILVIETNTPYTSVRPYRPPPAFTLFFYLERTIKDQCLAHGIE